jgi:hypothetical protein
MMETAVGAANSTQAVMNHRPQRSQRAMFATDRQLRPGYRFEGSDGCHRRRRYFVPVPSPIAAWAAASLATGTRKGLQET